MKEEEELAVYLLRVAELGRPLFLGQFCLKVVEITKDEDTPLTGGIPGGSWVDWYLKRHPTLSLGVVDGLETGI